MEIEVYRSYIVNLEEKDIYHVFDASMLLAKNVYNSSMFLLHNLIYSYGYDKATKSYNIKQHLHTNQLETIVYFNYVIKTLNADRLKKFNDKKEKLEKSNDNIPGNTSKDKKEKEFVPLSQLTDALDIQNFRAILLDKTLLEHTLKHKETCKNEFVDYTQIPSIVAQYATHKAVDDIAAYFKTLTAYFKSFQAGQKANVPQLPKYLGKNDRLTIELSYLRFGNRPFLFKIKPKKHTLYHDFYNKEDSAVPQSTIDNFNNFNLKETINDKINKRINKPSNKSINLDSKNNENLVVNKDFTLQTLRFVPQRKSGKGKNKHALKIEAIVSIKESIPDDSSLAKVITYYNNNKATYKKPTLNFESLPANTQQKVIKDYITQNPTEFINLAGCDMGMINIVALAFNVGKNQVYSATHINRELTKINVKLDMLKSEVFKSLLSTELLKKVLKNRDIAEQNKEIIEFNKKIINDNEKLPLLPKEKLSLEELKSIKAATSVIYENKSYQKTLIKLENYKKNILHQLSDQIIEHCAKNKIQCLVIGQNKNWKQELNLGKRNNRLFLSLPHSILIEQIQYKALAKGIVVITTEESYTSQASFINADEIPVYVKEHKSKKHLNNQKQLKDKSQENIKVMENENNHSHEMYNSNNKASSKKAIKLQRFSGTRFKHSYKLKKKALKEDNKPISIHADINGAFNIVCKIFKSFSYNKSIDLSYDLRGCNKKKYNKHKNDYRKSVIFSLLCKYC